MQSVCPVLQKNMLLSQNLKALRGLTIVKTPSSNSLKAYPLLLAFDVFLMSPLTLFIK